MANVNRCLEDDKGIFVCVGTFIFQDLETSKVELATVGKDFWICMPYSFGHNTLIFASKKYHPQAEIVLQVSDLLPDCEYYNTELQNASFVHPQYITKAITGIAKR
jgi:spermidine synthase